MQSASNAMLLDLFGDIKQVPANLKRNPKSLKKPTVEK
jgi:hypothetical protein